MAVMNYRKAIAEAIARVMRADDRVVFIGEDVGAAGGAFKSTVGLLEEFGPKRVRDTPIAEQAIVGAAMGAAMNGLRPIAEIMFADFLGVCWDQVANQVAKARYMTGGQVALPLVIRCHSGAGLGFGAQHSQSPESWAMSVPGLKVVSPSTADDVVGLLAAAVEDPDPVVFFEHKALFNVKADVPDGRHVVPLGQGRRVREGSDVTIVALAAMVRVAEEAADVLARDASVSADVLDLRSLVPLDLDAIAASVGRTGRLVVVEESPQPCGWAAEIVLRVVERDPSVVRLVRRVSGAPVPVPFAENLERAALPSAERVVAAVKALEDQPAVLR